MASPLKTLALSLLAFTILGAATPALAEDNPAFDRIKQLAGEWHGTHIDPETQEPGPIIARYEVSSGGTTVIEHLFAGTPHEMVSVYYPQGSNSVGFTHYCMIGNRPVLWLNKADDKTLSFAMTAPEGISSINEMHIHALTLQFDGPNKLHQVWTGYKDNQPQEPVTIDLTRQ